MEHQGEANRTTGLLVLAAYIGSVFAANWFMAHIGEQTVAGGPHTIPVGFGFQALSGVLWAGLAYRRRTVPRSTP